MRLIDADALVNHLEEVIKKQNGKSVDLVPIGELLIIYCERADDK